MDQTNEVRITGSLAMTEALKAILTHEGVPHSVAVGPNGRVICVEEADAKRMRLAVEQWVSAVNELKKACLTCV